MGQILLVRHGQASFGTSNYDQLSELGQEQGRLLGEWFANAGQRFHKVVVGGMNRHRQTADACLSRLPKPWLAETEWVTDPGFNEYDHEDVLHCHRPEFREADGIQRFLAASDNPKRAFQKEFETAMTRWMSGSHDEQYRESWPAFRARCVDALGRLTGGAGQSQSIIVFTSGGTIAAICQQLLRLPDISMAEINWNMVNASVTRLLYQPGKVTLSTLNNYAHLEWLGDKHSVTYR